MLLLLYLGLGYFSFSVKVWCFLDIMEGYLTNAACLFGEDQVGFNLKLVKTSENQLQRLTKNRKCTTFKFAINCNHEKNKRSKILHKQANETRRPVDAWPSGDYSGSGAL